MPQLFYSSVPNSPVQNVVLTAPIPTSVVCFPPDSADPGASCGGEPERQPRGPGGHAPAQAEGAAGPGQFPPQQRPGGLAAVRAAVRGRSQHRARGQRQGERHYCSSVTWHDF